MKVWTVATGNFDPFMPESVQAVELINKQDGLIGAHPHYPDGTLWLFESELQARRARKNMVKSGILCGKNVVQVEIDDCYGKKEDKSK